MFDYYKGSPLYSADAPHIIVTTVSSWRSDPFKTRADAQRFLEQYQVTQRYKEEHYSIVSVEEYWDKRHDRRRVYAL